MKNLLHDSVQLIKVRFQDVAWFFRHRFAVCRQRHSVSFCLVLTVQLLSLKGLVAAPYGENLLNVSFLKERNDLKNGILNFR